MARQVTAGRVGRPHGLDGSFYVDRPSEDLAEGTEVAVAGRRAVVERRAGTPDRPIIRLSGVADRDGSRAAAVAGEDAIAAAARRRPLTLAAAPAPSAPEPLLRGD